MPLSAAHGKWGLIRVIALLGKIVANHNFLSQYTELLAK